MQDAFRGKEAVKLFSNSSFGKESMRVFDPRVFCAFHGNWAANESGKGTACVLRPISRRTNHPWTKEFAGRKLDCLQDSDGVFVTFLSKMS